MGFFDNITTEEWQIIGTAAVILVGAVIAFLSN